MSTKYYQSLINNPSLSTFYSLVNYLAHELVADGYGVNDDPCLDDFPKFFRNHLVFLYYRCEVIGSSREFEYLANDFGRGLLGKAIDAVNGDGHVDAESLVAEFVENACNRYAFYINRELEDAFYYAGASDQMSEFVPNDGYEMNNLEYNDIHGQGEFYG